MASRTAVIVGGGIGGLTAALALGARRWQVQVLDQTPSAGPGSGTRGAEAGSGTRGAEAGSGTRGAEAGSGISLWPNALRALQTVGLRDAVRDLGRVEAATGIRNPAGAWLMRTSLAEVERRYGPLIVLHRADLMTTLLDALPAGTVRTGVRVHDVEAGPDGVVVRHSAGQTKADLVIGADGVHSTVRRLLWPAAAAPRYAGYTAWRLITRPAEPLTEGGETWGAGERFGVVPMPDGRVYCFATANTPAGAHSDRAELDELRRRFGRWHDPIPELLARADGDAVLRNDILEAPTLACYVAAGRVALLGDAAHAMTPNLGQGACQAMEDAVVLATVLGESSESTGIGEALARYDRLRRSRSQAIARRSRRIGRLGQWSWPPAVAARSLMVRMTPDRAFVTGLRPVLDWTPATS